HPDNEVLYRAIVATSMLGVKSLSPRLLSIGLDASQTQAVRVAALCAASKSNLKLSKDGFEFLTDQLKREGELRERLLAAEALGRFELDAAQRQRVAELAA